MEGYRPSTYGDRIADIYDSLYQQRLDPTETVAFLAELAGEGRALELGIGTGRVAIPLKEAGVEVLEIDASEAMVARLRAKPGGADIPVTLADFTDIEVEGQFRVVYVPFTTFFTLASQDEQVRCLQSVTKHLEPGGCFVLDVFVPDLTRFTMNQSTTTQEVALDHVLIDAMRHDPVAQTITGHHVVIDETGTRLYPLRVRYATPSELDLMARLAGLVLQDRFGWYDRSPFTAQSTRHVSVYTKPG